jgi:hypothetical protein
MSEIFYHTTCPGHPWLTKSANLILASYLRDSDAGLEFGSGKSTIWLARRVATLTSVEHNREWYEKVAVLLNEQELDNVTLLLIEADPQEGSRSRWNAYIDVIKEFPDDSLDFVLVDGQHRDACANAALPKIKSCGLLILDNANRYLPHGSDSPNSRTPALGPASEGWAKFLRQVRDWRCVWTSSGVTDTALFIKPGSQGAYLPKTELEGGIECLPGRQ